MPRTAPFSGNLSQLRSGLTAKGFAKVVEDLSAGWRLHPLWTTMALQDTRHRYRRSVIGPFWITISMGVMVAALGILYGSILNQPLRDYLPYLATGFIVWGFLASLVQQGATSFIAAEGMIKQMSAPLSIYVYRAVCSDSIVLAHNLVIYLVVVLVFQMNPGWTVLLAVPAILVMLLNGVWLGILLGMLSARFRDVPQIISTALQVLFFITPIIWKPEMLPGRALVLDANPFYHFVEIARAPMLGQLPAWESWVAVLGITLVGWILALAFYTVFRWRLAYWV